MKVALVYDRVNKFGGAERVLLALHEIWPEAPLYTSVYNPIGAPWADAFKVIPSFLQNFPLAKSNHELYAPLMPLAFESFSFNEYDLVISVTSESAKGIITKPKTFHLCYCLTPTRYLWSGYDEYFSNTAIKFLTWPLIKYLKIWDKVAGQRPDTLVAISKTVLERIKRYYEREGEVIYPPVDIDKFKVQPCLPMPTGRQAAGRSSKCKIDGEKYFLVVSRLVKYKKVDLAIETFNQLGWNLKIAGIGREMKSLKAVAKKNIEFLGELTDEELLFYYQNCQAIIFPQEEDFGIVALEAQACGKPVIAFRGGGATETIIEGKTGLLFGQQTAIALAAKLQSFKAAEHKAEDCQKQAEKFSKKRFKKEFKDFVEEKYKFFLTSR